MTLRVVLGGTWVLAAAVCLVEAWDDLGSRWSAGAWMVPACCLVVLVGCGWLARRGRYHWAAVGAVAVGLMLGADWLWRWGSDLPLGILWYALVIAGAGSLLGGQMALFTAGLVVGILGLVTWVQWHQIISPDTSWIQQPPAPVDMVLLALGFGFLATLVWLSSCKKALLWRQLRASARQLHDLANPLTAASLNLQQLAEAERSQAIEEIAQNLERACSYLKPDRGKEGGPP